MDEAAAKLQMDATSRPRALDEAVRKGVQLQMEILSLDKEAERGAKGAKERVARLRAEEAECAERRAKLQRQWDEEKGALTRISELREQLERIDFAISAAEKEYDLGRAAELKYAERPKLLAQLKAAEEAAAGREPAAGGADGTIGGLLS